MGFKYKTLKEDIKNSRIGWKKDKIVGRRHQTYKKLRETAMSMIMDSRSSQERESLATTTIFFEGKNCTDDVEIYPSKLTCDD